MTPWYAKRVRDAKRIIFDHPPLFRGLRFFWHVAIVPRETYRRVSHAWRTREFRTPQMVDVMFRGHRFTIEIDPANGLVDETIFARHLWDQQISCALCSLLEPGGTFVDIGANIGFFSLLASRIVGEHGTVFAFEPLPRLVGQARRSATANDITNLHVIPKACGAEPGRASIFTRPNNIGMSSLIKRDKGGVGHIHDIDVVKLDDALAAVPRVDLIKIDVEGYEYNVLLGARNTLGKHGPNIIMEFSPSLYEKIESGLTHKILDLLETHGYAMSFLDGRAIEDPRAFMKELAVRDRQLDVLCARAND